jgi:hypothetical protein
MKTPLVVICLALLPIVSCGGSSAQAPVDEAVEPVAEGAAAVPEAAGRPAGEAPPTPTTPDDFEQLQALLPTHEGGIPADARGEPLPMPV